MAIGKKNKREEDGKTREARKSKEREREKIFWIKIECKKGEQKRGREMGKEKRIKERKRDEGRMEEMVETTEIFCGGSLSLILNRDFSSS